MVNNVSPPPPPPPVMVNNVCPPVMVNNVSPPPPAGQTPSPAGPGVAEASPEYMAFVLVPVFFTLGLLGVLICHLLKRRGYRCTTGEPPAEGEEPEEDLELGGDLNDTFSENNDTVGQIVHMIMSNEANSDALKAMVEQNSIDSDGPPLTPTSPPPSSPPRTPVWPGPPRVPRGAVATSKHTCSHLHTIGGPGGPKNTCSRCSQKKWPLMRRPLTPRRSENRRSHQGEVTVLAVGRFRVTKSEKQPRERRTLPTSEANGSAPTSPDQAEPKSRTTSESQQEPTK
uniref:RELT-like protein 1 n=1 Tax=Gadus morhua TaxID=8049 RepID=A0A8C5C811_GADMO